MITHLEPDILECEVKWASGSITMNKASGGDGIPAGLFQILKDDAVKMLHSVCQQIWKTQQWPQDWKRSVFIPIPNGLWPARLLCPWDFPGENTGVDCYSLLRRIFLTQGLNPSLLHCRQILYRLNYREDPTPKKGNAKECPNYCTMALISHTSKVILNILQARLQKYVN